MQKYILFKNQAYAGALAKKTNAIIRSSEENLNGTRLQNGDIVIVDAHYKGNMSDLKGIEIVKNMQKYVCKDKDVKFKILSWFPLEWFDEKPEWKSKKDQLEAQHNVEFVQLPVSDVALLTS